MRSENLENIKFWKVVRMGHAIVENDGMPRGILLQMSFSPNVQYRATNILKIAKINRSKGFPRRCISAQAHDGMGAWQVSRILPASASVAASSHTEGLRWHTVRHEMDPHASRDRDTQGK